MIFVGKRLEDERTRCDHTVQQESTDHTVQQESTLLQKLGGTCRNPPPSCR
jgi:porphobilinogen deaminase